MRPPTPLSLFLLIAVFSSAAAFLSPTFPLRSHTTSTASRNAFTPGFPTHALRGFGGRTLQMSQDGNDNIDDDLKKITDSKQSSLDKAMSSDEEYNKMAAEAARRRVEELKEKAKNMPKPPERKPGEIIESPSFISQSVGQAKKEAMLEAEKEAELQVERKKKFQGVEVDPRGFIVPQIGDIVLCPGKWANEDMVALVEDTQFVDARMSWNVDVIELSSVGPSLYGRQYSAWKKPIKRWFDVSEVRPARAEYVDEQDAWRVENARDYINNPVIVNETARVLGLEEYGALKTKIITETAVLGLGGSVALAAYDPNLASSFAIGAVASIAYIGLLASKVETVGPEGSPNAGPPLLSPRFLAPLGLFVALYFKYTHFQALPGGELSGMGGGMPKVPPKDIAAAAIGFLCYKLPLLYESSRQVMLTVDDTTEALEKGVSNGYKQWQVRVQDNFKDARERESNPQTSLNPFTKIRLTVEQQYKEKEERERRESEESE
mmetsp:Transcript_43592/g.102473  ORF Transcript_43592/g.102473 Transcript_43592/m.102473 type:complete len:492 (-) Transcript_43592:51-1526(-)